MKQAACRLTRVPMRISIPPKYAASAAVAFIEGKSAIHPARVDGERKAELCRAELLGAWYFVSTLGRNEAAIRESIRNREKEDERPDLLNLRR